MKRKRDLLKVFLLVLPLLLTLNFSTALADDDHRERHEEDSWMEEVGETLGWGSVFVASAAGMLLPARRMVKPVKEYFPAGQKSLVSVVKGLTKYHIWIGVTAVGISLIHGISMYFAEDHLDIGDWVGAGSATLMIVAGVIGGMLAVNKKSIKRWKKTHIHLLLAAGFFAIIHILAS